MRTKKLSFWREVYESVSSRDWGKVNVDFISWVATDKIRAVINMPSANVPAFCNQKNYKNAYQRIGKKAPKVSNARRIVDDALPLPRETAAGDITFCALEVNGTGVHFFGDMCLVLRSVAQDTIILQSNSYDLTLMPMAQLIDRSSNKDRRRKDFARRMSGTWAADAAKMLAAKVLSSTVWENRRLPLGEISQLAVVDDHYIEVLCSKPVNLQDIELVRMDPIDSTYESIINDREARGVAPSVAEFEWRLQRHKAEEALRDHGLKTVLALRHGRRKQ